MEKETKSSSNLIVHYKDKVVFQIEELTPPKELLPEIPRNEVLGKFVGEVDVSNKGPEKLVDLGTHPFLYGMYQAYADHRPFVISPDMIWLLICQAFASHVNSNSQKLSELLGDFTHGQKEKIIIRNDFLSPGCSSLLWEPVLDEFGEEIRKRVKGELVENIIPNFSTTTNKERFAGIISLMNTFDSFFEYKVLTIICGIPQITLEGNIHDWQKLRKKAWALREYKLESWIDEIDYILEKFIDVFEDKLDQDFWRKIFKIHEIGGCGIPDVIDGWILTFYPFDKKGRRRESYCISNFSSLPDEVLKVDFKHHYAGPIQTHTRNLQFVSGFIGAEQNSDNFAIRPYIDWFIAPSSEEEKLPESIEGYASLSFGQLRKFPSEILNSKSIGYLSLHFIEEVKIPKDLKKVEIGEFYISGKMSEEEIIRIANLLPKTSVFVNGEEVFATNLKSRIRRAINNFRHNYTMKRLQKDEFFDIEEEDFFEPAFKPIDWKNE